MPNHIKNKIIFSGDQQKIDELLELIKSDKEGFGTIDFNKIIPMPESLYLDAGSTETEAINSYLTAINPITANYKIPKMEVPEFILLLKQMNQRRGFGEYDPNLSADKMKSDMVELGEKYVTNFQKYSSTTWYDWAISNWGSKWNAYQLEPLQDNTITYSTAWSRVLPVITKLAEMAPDLDIEYQWADEDMGNNVGFAEFSGGKLINECIHEPWSNEAYELCAELREIDLAEEGLFLDEKSGTYVWRDEEEMEKGMEIQMNNSNFLREITMRKILGIAVSLILMIITAIPISAQAIYPYDVAVLENSDDDNRRDITKYYELAAGETPDAIPQEPFEQDGFSYVLTDIVQNSKADIITKTGKRMVTIETESDKMEEILKALPLTADFSNKNGFTGEIPLDISSIKVESKGTGYGSSKVTATREFPNLSSNDTSLVPKSVTEKGVECTLDNVEWRSLRLDDIDADEVVVAYTACAKYSGTYSYSYSKGYTVTAEYRGDVSKTESGKTVCEARFVGTRIVHDEPVEIATEETEIDTSPSESKNIVLPILLGALGLGICGATIFVFIKQDKKIKSLTRTIKQAEYSDFRESEEKYIYEDFEE